MDQVLVRVKRLRKNPYKKLLSDTKLYPTLDPTAVSMVDYNPDHNLDEDAWFKIEKFSEQEFYIGELNGDLDTKDYDDLSKGKFKDISSLKFMRKSIFPVHWLTVLDEQPKAILVRNVIL